MPDNFNNKLMIQDPKKYAIKKMLFKIDWLTQRISTSAPNCIWELNKDKKMTTTK